MGLSMGHAIYRQDLTGMLTIDRERLCHLSFAIMSVTHVQYKQLVSPSYRLAGGAEYIPVDAERGHAKQGSGSSCY